MFYSDAVDDSIPGAGDRGADSTGSVLSTSPKLAQLDKQLKVGELVMYHSFLCIIGTDSRVACFCSFCDNLLELAILEDLKTIIYSARESCDM